MHDELDPGRSGARRWGAARACVLLATGNLAGLHGEAPPPERTPVELVVSGRTSTLRSIAIESLDQTVPRTFAGDQLANVEGFCWFVSRHYALQTDYGEVRARHLLSLLELAYPH